AKSYPDLSPTAHAFPTKRSLEGHYSLTFRNFDLATPDSMTTESYRLAKEATNGGFDPVVTRSHPNTNFRGQSRLGEWLEEFREHVANLEAGRPDRMPHLSVLRFSNHHTHRLHPG